MTGKKALIYSAKKHNRKENARLWCQNAAGKKVVVYGAKNFAEKRVLVNGAKNFAGKRVLVYGSKNTAGKRVSLVLKRNSREISQRVYVAKNPARLKEFKSLCCQTCSRKEKSDSMLWRRGQK